MILSMSIISVFLQLCANFVVLLNQLWTINLNENEQIDA